MCKEHRIEFHVLSPDGTFPYTEQPSVYVLAH
jgi:hypothetical protein